MPAYVNSPFQVPLYVQPGVASYLFGSYNNHQGNTVMNVSQVALASNVATVTGQIISGEVPAVGSLISVRQTVTGSGEFNVNRATVTAVSINNNGFGTISYALTGGNVSATADFGTAIVEAPEIPETLVAGTSIACVFQAPYGDGQYSVPVSVTFPTMPSAVSVSLQAALHNIDSEFTSMNPAVSTVVSGAYTIGPYSSAALQRGYFYRLIVSGITGTGTILAKIGG